MDAGSASAGKVKSKKATGEFTDGVSGENRHGIADICLGKPQGFIFYTSFLEMHGHSCSYFSKSWRETC